MGSLAHEYGHFLDNLLGKKNNRYAFLSGGRSTRTGVDERILRGRKNTPAWHMEKLFQILYWKDNGEPTEFLKLNSSRNEYFRRRTEVFARTFEAYVYLRLKELGIRNTWLVSGSPDEEWPPLSLVRKGKWHIRALFQY